MKTRYQMLYDFMIALASNPKFTYGADDLLDIGTENYEDIAKDVYLMATKLTDQFWNDTYGKTHVRS